MKIWRDRDKKYTKRSRGKERKRWGEEMAGERRVYVVGEGESAREKQRV